MSRKKLWTPYEDSLLRLNYHESNEALGELLGCSAAVVVKRYRELAVARPSDRNALLQARHSFARERYRGAVPNEWFELPLTRTDAKLSEASFFWTGIPCERAGHVDRRKTSSSGCWACQYSDHRQRLASDPEYAARRLQDKRQRYESNRDEYLAKQREYKKTAKAREWYRNYEKNKRNESPEWVLAKSLRDRLYSAISRNDKFSSAVELIGCSLSHLQKHLEHQFAPSMSWENYGDWHIDHIRPCISFDLSDPEQQRQCFHYSNLRPLWAFENRSKGGVWNGVDPRRRSRQAEREQGDLFSDDAGKA